MSRHARSIEAFFRERYAREALYLPSGRLALFLAFEEWLVPGDRIIMSPVNDDVVFFTVLAAGLVPVIAPLDPRTGNLDPTAIPDASLREARAVLTTNLYGTPDRMDVLEARCREHGTILLEDAAHAIDSRCAGRRIGDFGVAAAFSLGKHVGIYGGALTFADPSRRESVAARAAALIRRRPLHVAAAHRVRGLLSRVGTQSRFRRWLARRRDEIVARPRERSGHRIRYNPDEVMNARAAGGGLHRFERWVRVDNYMYRTWPLRSALRATRALLTEFETSVPRRRDGARRVLELGLTAPGFDIASDTTPLRVPLLVRERERARVYLAEHGVKTYYIYDPPLDAYAPELVETIASSASAISWSTNVLPVDPLVANRVLELVKRAPELFEPLTPNPTVRLASK